MLRKIYFGFLLLFSICSQANAASSTLGNLSAGSAISATDLFYDVQSVGSGGVKVTGTQLTTFFQGALKCGSSTNICFNSSNTFGGDSGLTYAGSGGVLTLTPAANTAQPLLITGGSTTGSGTGALGLSVVGTLNTSGVVDGAVLFANILNTGSGAGTLLMDLQVGSASKFNIDKSGNLAAAGNVYVGGATQSTDAFISGNNILVQLGFANTAYWSVSSTIVEAKTTAYIGWNTPIGSAAQAAFWTEGAGLISQGQPSTATSASTYRVYNTTDTLAAAPTNYERGVLDWTTSANVFIVGTQKGGTGSVRNMEFVIGGTNKLDYGVTTAGTWTMSGNFNAPGVASLSAATTAWLCWTTSTGAVSEDSASCITSLRALKDNITPLADATGALLALKPSNFTWRSPLDRNQQGLQFGFIAEDVEQADPRLASYSRDGKLHGWRQDSVIALLVRGFQEQQAEIEQLKRRAAVR